MKIIQLTTDNREHYGQYDNPMPHFGATPEALLEGFSGIPNVGVHVISYFRHPILSPNTVFGNLRYHTVIATKSGWLTTLYQGCIRATRRLIREIDADIVHSQMRSQKRVFEKFGPW